MSKKLIANKREKTKMLEKFFQLDNNTSIVSRSGRHSSSSGPETWVIANIQKRINNPLFELSIADYELMCDNKTMIRMMSKVLECDEKQLKKFCKYINVFKENINSSPKSIKNKMKPKMTLDKLPKDLYYKIVEQYTKLFPTKYGLRSWISKDNLDDWNLSRNPLAIDFLKENPRKIAWGALSMNPNAIELLTANKNKIASYWLSANPNPDAIKLLNEKYNEEKAMNPIDLFNLEKFRKINWEFLSANPNAIELLRENPKKIDWKQLSANPNAIELLKANPNEIDWKVLSANPNAIELLRAKKYRIDWKQLSANPNAIELLRANKGKIDWEELIANPNAIELIKENLDEIINNYGLYGLAENKNTEALELLQKYPQYIRAVGSELSGNPNPKAIELLRDNINIIDLQLLSLNPSLEAIKLLREHPEKIDWKLLSGNPAIFEEL
jgi:hypothetical protein